jgi:hypothetical protein
MGLLDAVKTLFVKKHMLVSTMSSSGARLRERFLMLESGKSEQMD